MKYYNFFFFFHTIQGRNKQKPQFRTLHHTCSRRRKTTKMNWYTGCHFSYKPGLFNNYMGNTNHMTMKARSRQKIQISQPSTIMPIRSCFHLEGLQKMPAVSEIQNLVKTLIFSCQTSFNHSLQQSPSCCSSIATVHSKKHPFSLNCYSFIDSANSTRSPASSPSNLDD